MSSELIRRIARFLLSAIVIFFISLSTYVALRRWIFKSEPTSSLHKEAELYLHHTPILIL